MDPGTVLAIVQLSAKVISEIWKYSSAVKGARADIDRLRAGVEDFQRTFQTLHDQVNGPKGEKLLLSRLSVQTSEHARSDVEELLKLLNPGKRSRFIRKAGLHALEWPFRKEDVDKYLGRLERYKTDANLALQIDQTAYLHDIDTGVSKLNVAGDQAEIDRQLAKLPVAHGARFDSSQQESKPRCIPDTRVDVLQEIDQWSTRQGQHVYWLSGVAGSGKSTISRTVSQKFRDDGCLAGSFFFSRGGGDLGSAAKFVTTIARQIASYWPLLRAQYSRIISEDEDILSQGLSNQWKQLIQRPLREAEIPLGARRLIFVVDALDECDRDEDIHVLLKLLFTLAEARELNVRVFVTSRPEIIINKGFLNAPDILHQDLNLGDVPRHVVEKDINKYLVVELESISADNNLSGWPTFNEIANLGKKCDSLFIYASTACKFIADPTDFPKERLSLLLESTDDDGLNLPELDRMYMRVLKYSILKGREGLAQTRLVARFHQVVAPFLLLNDTLSASALSYLLNVGMEDLEKAFTPLHSLVYYPQNDQTLLRALHPSFRDFLVDHKRCASSPFRLEVDRTHSLLLKSCLHTLSTCLRKDMCRLRWPGININEVPRSSVESGIPGHVKYACLYWVDHLEKSSPKGRAEAGFCENVAVHIFFQKHFLPWIEAMSIMRRMRESVLMILKLIDLLQSNSEGQFEATVNDAKKFVLGNRSVIEQSPLQTYLSALLFSPLQSLMRKAYSHHLPSWVTRVSNATQEWSLASQVLEAEKSLSTMCFSPDSSLIAAAGYSYVHIWETTTAGLLLTLERSVSKMRFFIEDNSWRLMTFSPPSLCVWDVQTGELKRQNLVQNSRSTPDNVAISANCRYLACPARWNKEGAILIYDTESADIRLELVGHTSDVRSLQFSPFSSSKCLASDSEDGTMRLWNVETGECTRTIANAGSHPIQLTFTSDGRQLLEWCRNELRLFNVETGRCRTLHVDFSGSATISFFRNDEWMVTGMWNGDVCIWNLESGEMKKLFQGGRYIEKIAVSPDSRHVAAFDGAIRLLDATRFLTSARVGFDVDHSINKVQFSPDGTQLVTLSHGHIVKIWDTTEGALLHKWTDVDNIMTSVIGNHVRYMNDGKLLTVNSEHGTKIRDGQTGDIAMAYPSIKPESTISHVHLSPDFTRLIIREYGGHIRVWNLTTQELAFEMMDVEAKKRPYEFSVAFSLDGQYAALNEENHIRLCQLAPTSATDIFLDHIDEHRMSYNPNDYIDKDEELENELFPDAIIGVLVFSPDGAQLVAATNRCICVWNARVNGPPHTQFLYRPGRRLSSSSDHSAVSANVRWFAARETTGNLLLFDLAKHCCHELRLNWFSQLAFTDGDRFLSTDQGCLRLDPEATVPDDDSSISDDGSTVDDLDSAIDKPTVLVGTPRVAVEVGWSYVEPWICYDGRNVLRVPSELIPSQILCRDNLFAMVQRSKPPLLVELDRNGPFVGDE